MLQKYDSFRKEIIELESNKDFIEQEKKIREYINTIENNDQYLAEAYYWLARVLFKLDTKANYNQIVESAQKSIQFCGQVDNEIKIKSYWLLSRTYSKVDILKENNMLDLYKKCETYYRQQNNKSKLLADVLNNIANITKDVDKIKESLDIYERLYESKVVGKKDIDEVYDSAYKIFKYNAIYDYADLYFSKITTL